MPVLDASEMTLPSSPASYITIEYLTDGSSIDMVRSKNVMMVVCTECSVMLLTLYERIVMSCVSMMICSWEGSAL